MLELVQRLSFVESSALAAIEIPKLRKLEIHGNSPKSWRA